MSKTEKYLSEAFAGESQANRKYLAFAKKADQEGYTQLRLASSSGRLRRPKRCMHMPI